MTTQEFSNQFDVLYNNIMSNQAPGIDEYEKSIFLTKAQEDLVRNYFNARNVKNAQGFDDSQKRQYDFSTLLSTVSMTDYTDTLSILSSKNIATYNNVFDSRSKIFVAPPDLFLAINESIEDSTKRRYSVLPISYDEYNRLMLKPYGYPLKRQAWRIISDKATPLVGWGGKEFQIDEDTNVIFLFKNIYYKPVNIRIVLTSGTSLIKPTIAEGEDKVNIVMRVPRSAPTNYWNTYLVNDTKLQSCGLDKYIAPLDGDTTGLFPSVLYESIPNFNINIMPGITKTGESISTPAFEVIGRFNGDIDYTMRYVKTPRPIILVELDDIQEGLSINGENTVTECELPVNTHQEILQRAVELAKASYTGDLASIIQTGNASGTEIGYISNQSRQ